MAYDTRAPGGTMYDEPDINRARQERLINGDRQRHAPARDRSLVSLIRDLRDESINLVQDEVRLARAEMHEKIDELRQGAIAIATGGAVLAAGLLMLLLAAAAGLYAAMWALEVDPLISGWLSPLIIGVIAAVVGWAMIAAGKKKVEPSNLRPERTERSLRETGSWAERKV